MLAHRATAADDTAADDGAAEEDGHRNDGDADRLEPAVADGNTAATVAAVPMLYESSTSTETKPLFATAQQVINVAV